VALGADVIVHVPEDALDRVEAVALRDRLVGSGLVDLVGRPPVEPVVGSAQPQALGADDADVIRRKRLAEKAGIEGLHRFVGQRLEPPVPLVVHRAGDRHPPLHLVGLGDQRHPDLVDERGVLAEQLGVEDPPVVLEPQSLLEALLGDAGPDDVALPHVPDPGGAVQEVVDLTLQDRLEVRLHLAAGHLHPDPERERGTLLHRIDVGPDDLDLPVVDLVERDRGEELEGGGLVSTELDPHLGLADVFPFEGGPEGHRDRDARDAHLAAANLERPLDHRLVRHARHHVLVGADPARQDLGDLGVRDHGKAVVDGAGRHRVLLRVDLAEREHEGEDAVLVVPEVRFVVPGPDAAEGERHPAGEAEGVHQRGDVAAEGDQPRLPAQLHALLGQLLGELPAVAAPGQEDVEVLLLQLARDPHRDLVGRRSAGDRGEAGRGSVDELDAAFAKNDVRGGPQPEVSDGVGTDQVLARLDDLAGEERRHAGVERGAEVGEPGPVRRPLREQSPGAFQDSPAVAQCLHLLLGQRVDDRQEVGGVPEADRCALAHRSDGFAERGLGASHPSHRPIDGARADQPRHRSSSGPSCP
jgi:hypothetical protein